MTSPCKSASHAKVRINTCWRVLKLRILESFHKRMHILSWKSVTPMAPATCNRSKSVMLSLRRRALKRVQVSWPSLARFQSITAIHSTPFLADIFPAIKRNFKTGAAGWYRKLSKCFCLRSLKSRRVQGMRPAQKSTCLETSTRSPDKKKDPANLDE